MRITIPVATLALVLCPVFGSAQNLLLNPDFDVDTSGWDIFGTWSSEDWQDSGASGSAIGVNDLSSTGTTTIIKQCIDLPNPEASYLLSGWLLVEPSAGETGSAKYTIVWYDLPGCSGFLTGFDSSKVFADSGWQDVSFEQVPEASTESVRVSAYLYKSVADGSLQGYADHVFFGSPLIFSDDFETGDDSLWTSATP